MYPVCQDQTDSEIDVHKKSEAKTMLRLRQKRLERRQMQRFRKRSFKGLDADPKLTCEVEGDLSNQGHQPQQLPLVQAKDRVSKGVQTAFASQHMPMDTALGAARKVSLSPVRARSESVLTEDKFLSVCQHKEYEEMFGTTGNQTEERATARRGFSISSSAMRVPTTLKSWYIVKNTFIDEEIDLEQLTSWAPRAKSEPPGNRIATVDELAFGRSFTDPATTIDDAFLA